MCSHEKEASVCTVRCVRQQLRMLLADLCGPALRKVAWVFTSIRPGGQVNQPTTGEAPMMNANSAGPPYLACIVPTMPLGTCRTHT